MAFPDIPARGGIGSERAFNPRVAIDSVLPFWVQGMVGPRTMGRDPAIHRSDGATREGA